MTSARHTFCSLSLYLYISSDLLSEVNNFQRFVGCYYSSVFDFEDVSATPASCGEYLSAGHSHRQLMKAGDSREELKSSRQTLTPPQRFHSAVLSETVMHFTAKRCCAVTQTHSNRAVRRCLFWTCKKDTASSGWSVSEQWINSRHH